MVDATNIDEWLLEQPSILDMSLEEVIRAGEFQADKDSGITRLTFPFSQPHFLLILNRLRRRERASMAKVGRFCSKHGLELLKSEERYRNLGQWLGQVEEEMSLQSDADSAGVLVSPTKLHPSGMTTQRLTISVYAWVHGALGELAYDLGLYLADTTFFCCLASLRTCSGISSYRSTIDADLDRFWKYVERRRMVLEGLRKREVEK